MRRLAEPESFLDDRSIAYLWVSTEIEVDE